MKTSVLCLLVLLSVVSLQGIVSAKSAEADASKALEANKKSVAKLDKRAMAASQVVENLKVEDVKPKEVDVVRRHVQKKPKPTGTLPPGHPVYHPTRLIKHTKRTVKYHHTKAKTTTSTTTTTTTENSGDGPEVATVSPHQRNAGGENSATFQFKLTISNVNPSAVTPAVVTNAVVQVITSANPSSTVTSANVVIDSISGSRRRASTVLVQFSVVTNDPTQQEDVENSLASSNAGQSLTQSLTQDPGLSGATVSLTVTSAPPTVAPANPIVVANTDAPETDNNGFPAGCPSPNSCDAALDLYLLSKAYAGCDCGLNGPTCDGSDGQTDCACCATLCSFLGKCA